MAIVRPTWLLMCACCLLAGANLAAQQSEPSPTLRAGMIGLDTSHVNAFTNIINDSQATGDLANKKKADHQGLAFFYLMS